MRCERTLNPPYQGDCLEPSISFGGIVRCERTLNPPYQGDCLESSPLIRGARGVHLLRHPPAERPLRQRRSHEKKRRRQSSGTSWPFFPSSPSWSHPSFCQRMSEHIQE